MRAVALAVVVLLAAGARGADGTIRPQMRCEAYGRLVECRASDVGGMNVEWAAICTAAHPDIQRSTGERFAFRLQGRTQIEMHLPDLAGGFTPLREWAFWYHGRVVFAEWKDPDAAR